LSSNDKVLQLLINAGIGLDENFAPIIRLKAFIIALETALEIQIPAIDLLKLKLD
jgi:hypothetical protein